MCRHDRILHALSVMLDSSVIAWHGIGAEAIARLALNPDNEEIMSAWGNKVSTVFMGIIAIFAGGSGMFLTGDGSFTTEHLLEMLWQKCL